MAARDYAKVAPSFWTGTTGRALRGHPEAQLVALYLITGPLANMIGLFDLPVAVIASHTGLSLKAASKGLYRLIEVGFCQYDHDREEVLVTEMARFQVGEQLDPRDNRVAGIQRQTGHYRSSQLYAAFFERYEHCFHLHTIGDGRPTEGASQGASKPLRSQEQEQEQEQEQDAESSEPAAPASEPPSEVVLIFPTVGTGGKAWHLTRQLVDELGGLFPSLDILAECRKALAWVHATPAKRKTGRGMRGFLTRWLTKATDDPRRSVAVALQRPPARPSFGDIDLPPDGTPARGVSRERADEIFKHFFADGHHSTPRDMSDEEFVRIFGEIAKPTPEGAAPSVEAAARAPEEGGAEC